jgi:hypothetical protein
MEYLSIYRSSQNSARAQSPTWTMTEASKYFLEALSLVKQYPDQVLSPFVLASHNQYSLRVKPMRVRFGTSCPPIYLWKAAFTHATTDFPPIATSDPHQRSFSIAWIAQGAIRVAMKMSLGIVQKGGLHKNKMTILGTWNRAPSCGHPTRGRGH